MLDPRIRLRHLRCFLETARLGSLTAAANAMHVSQPAASKTIKELEQILGRPLFDRSARRLTLTPAGKVFQQHTGAALIELARGQDLVTGVPRVAKRVAAGALPTAATTLMPSASLAFREAFPTCLLRVSTGPNWLLMSQLREGSLDLVVGRMGPAKVMEGLSFQPLYSEKIIAIVRPSHPLCNIADAAARLSEYPIIVPPSGAVISHQVQAMLTRHSIPVGTQAFETVSLAFGRGLVQRSNAIWFISRGVVAAELAEGSLAELPIEENALGAPVGISTREDGSLSEEQEGLIAALRSASSSMPDNGDTAGADAQI
ncbi:MAG: pca operon transcription factor PcaQ [Pseudomonadota bacterium]